MKWQMRAGNSGLHWVYFMEAKVILNTLSSESLTCTQICLSLDNFLFISFETMECFTNSHFFHKFLMYDRANSYIRIFRKFHRLCSFTPPMLATPLVYHLTIISRTYNDPGNFY